MLKIKDMLKIKESRKVYRITQIKINMEFHINLRQKDFKTKKTIRNKFRYYIMVIGSIL